MIRPWKRGKDVNSKLELCGRSIASLGSYGKTKRSNRRGNDSYQILAAAQATVNQGRKLSRTLN